MIGIPALVVVMGVSGGPVTKETSTPPAPPVSAEVARLQRMVGTYDVELKFWFDATNPNAMMKTRGVSVIKSLYGTFIEERIEGLLGEKPFGTLSITGFNVDRKVYEATRVASTNTIRIAETGTFDEKSGALVL